MAKRRYHRMPDRVNCELCRAKKGYKESGHWYCQNGHRVEGWIEVDEEGGDHIPQYGHTTRAQKEVKEKKQKHLSGAIARELFLECLQVILRKQLLWLIRSKGLPPDLEVVVRDLWDLRIRNLEGVRGASETYVTTTKGRSGVGGGSKSASEEMLFSSQVAPESEDETGSVKGRKVDLEWSGDSWIVPSIRDTLGLCYLGCVLLREPVRIGDFYNWVRSGGLPYFGAVELLPVHLRERLPPYGQKLLKALPSSLQGSNLQDTVTELMLGYKKNWDISFPSLNIPPLLTLYLRDLVLPPHVYTHVEQMVPLLGFDFAFPSRKQEIFSVDTQKFRSFDNPDVLLAASVVVAMKYLCPMDDVERCPRDVDDPLGLKLDWEVWTEAFTGHKHGNPEFEKIRSGEVGISSLAPEEQDAYLDWEQNMLSKPSEGPGTLLQQCFPLRNTKTDSRQSVLQDIAEDRSDKVQRSFTWLPPRHEEEEEEDVPKKFGNILRIGQKFPRYKHEDDLSGTAKIFYEVMADVSGMALKDLVWAVYIIERALHQQSSDSRKAAEAI